MMKLRDWEDLPKNMQTKEVWKYYQILTRKRKSIVVKRVFDIVFAIILLIVLSPVMLVISIMIALDSKGGVFFHQVRVTTYGKKFYIHKFRTMVKDTSRDESQVAANDDERVTRVGKILRRSRLDEIPQLINVLNGDMSFVGTRPETIRYVKKYNREMLATLLLPAGITSEASICYKDEADLLNIADDLDAAYLSKILPAKMEYNLESIRRFSFLGEIRTLFKTIYAVCGKEYQAKR